MEGTGMETGDMKEAVDMQQTGAMDEADAMKEAGDMQQTGDMNDTELQLLSNYLVEIGKEPNIRQIDKTQWRDRPAAGRRTTAKLRGPAPTNS